MPVRQIPKNYRNVTRLVASARLGSAVQFESSLERDFILILDMLFSTVADFEEQPSMADVSEWKNGYCESFNSKLRDEFLNGEIFCGEVETASRFPLLHTPDADYLNSEINALH